MTIDELGSELNKIELQDGKKGLSGKDLDIFLANEENVRNLGSVMEENFDTNSELLNGLKNSIGKICERILKNGNITPNQALVLNFFIVHFYDDKYSKKFQNCLMQEENLKIILENGEDNFLSNTEAFNRFKTNVGKICDKIWRETVPAAGSITLLKFFIMQNYDSKDKIWNNFKKFVKNENGLKTLSDLMSDVDAKAPGIQEKIGKICEILLQNKDLSSNRYSIPIFKFYVTNFCLSTNLTFHGTEVPQDFAKNFVRTYTFNDDIIGKKILQTLESRTTTGWNTNNEFYKYWGDIEQKRIGNRFHEKSEMPGIDEEFRNIIKPLLDSPNPLGKDNIQLLQQYKDKLVNGVKTETTAYKKEGMYYKINKIGKKLESAAIYDRIHKEVDDIVDKETTDNPLANLDVIDENLKNLTPNWGLITSNVKRPEDVTQKITPENIGEYLSITNDIDDEYKMYITRNFQKILLKHLCFHPEWKRGYGKDPEKQLVGISIKNIVGENNIFQKASEGLEKLKSKGGLTKKMQYIIAQKNHILFDVRLRHEIGSTKTTAGKGERLLEIFKKLINSDGGKDALSKFKENNGFVADMYENYKVLKKAEDEYNKEKTIMDKAEDKVKDRDGNRVKIFSKQQLEEFACYVPVWDRRGWKYRGKTNKEFEKDSAFWNLYKYSKDVWKAIKEDAPKLGLPDDLPAQDYYDYNECFNKSQDNIRQTNAWRKQEEGKIMNYVDAQTAMEMRNLINEKANKINESRVVYRARKFVKLRQKSRSQPRPNNFEGIPLRWEKGPNPENIIRESLREQLGDKWDNFVENIKKDPQKFFGELRGLLGGSAVAVAVTARTGSPMLGGAAYEVCSTLCSGVGEALYDFTVDGPKKLLGMKEEGNNRYDGPVDAFLLGVGKNKRDADGKAISAMPLEEWAVNKAFDIASAALAGAIASPLAQPFTHAFTSNFVVNPLKNVTLCASKAALGMGDYDGTNMSFRDRVSNATMTQMDAEFGSLDALSKKALTTVVIGTALKGMSKLISGPFSKYFKKFDVSFENKLDQQENIAKRFLTQLGKNGGGASSDVVSDLLSSGYERNVTKGLATMSMILATPLVSLDLLKYDAPPSTVCQRRINLIQKKLQDLPDGQERTEYETLLAQYQNAKIWIKENVGNDGGSNTDAHENGEYDLDKHFNPNPEDFIDNLKNNRFV